MKIEIDLNDILGDEDGAETLQESVKRQVVEKLTSTIRDGIGKKLDYEVARVIGEEIKAAVKLQMPTILDDLLNTEYRPVGQWGDRDGMTTFRKELVKQVTAQLKYEKKQYEQEKNVFTKVIDEITKEQVGAFKIEFDRQINGCFIKEAMDYATAQLKARLGIK